MTWGRVKGGAELGRLVEKMIAGFDPIAPQNSTAALAEFETALGQHPGVYDAINKRVGLNDLTGLSIEVLATEPWITLSDSLNARVELVNRSDRSLEWGAKPNYRGRWFPHDHSIGIYSHERRIESITSPPWFLNGTIDEPVWLREKHGNLYVSSQSDLIDPTETEGGYTFYSSFLDVSGSRCHPSTPLTYKWVDRVAGERIRPVYVTPVASVIPKSDVLIATGGTQTITVEVEALTDSLTGQLSMTPPAGWIASRDSWPVNLAKRNERQVFTFSLKPESGAQPGATKFTFSGPKGKADRTLHEIDYPHIMPQVYYTPAEVKLVPLDVKTTAKRVGYVKGAGDDVPQAMEQLGVAVEFIEPSSAKLEELRKYDAIVTGIRAYNATKGMKELHPLLLQYVEEGGTLIVQYNTTPRFFSGASDFQIDPATLGPHPFTIGRGRVTVEEAPPTFIDPKHPLLTTPNTITAADFDGWVQERGLYFASDLSTDYTPLIAWNDPGEEPLNGALIVADHGKGRFIYTGISFFRQLPAGVGGAYRLWANMISPRTVK
jgi:hypothetical protein